MIVQHHIEETNQRRPARGVARKLTTAAAKENFRRLQLVHVTVCCVYPLHFHS